jgi:hypothetical protein
MHEVRLPESANRVLKLLTVVVVKPNEVDCHLTALLHVEGRDAACIRLPIGIPTWRTSERLGRCTAYCAGSRTDERR